MPRTDGTQLRLLLAAGVQNALGFCLSRTRGNVPALSRATEPADLDDEQLLDLITEQGAALCRKYGGYAQHSNAPTSTSHATAPEQANGLFCTRHSK